MDVWTLIDEAIENLRARKCRPDVDNIFGMLIKKKCQITKDSLENALHQLESQNKVYRYRFKGRISYRQTAQMTVRHSGRIDEQGSCDNTGLYSSDTEEDSQPIKGESDATVNDDESATVRTVPGPTVVEDRLQGTTQLTSAAKTVANSDLPQGENCERNKKRAIQVSEIEGSEEAESLSKPRGDGLTIDTARVSSRKRIKKSHGPDFQTEVLHVDCKLQLSTCAICRNKDQDQHLLQCSACKIHVHASCLQLTERSILKISANKQFFCLRCKPCKYCHIALETVEGLKDSPVSLATVIESDDVLHCSHCYSVFHLGCVRPALTAKPKGTPWMCRRCMYEINKRHRAKETVVATGLETEAASSEMSPSPAGRKSNRQTDKERHQRNSRSSPEGNLISGRSLLRANGAKSAQKIRSGKASRRSCDSSVSSSSVMSTRDDVPVRMQVTDQSTAADQDDSNDDDDGGGGGGITPCVTAKEHSDNKRNNAIERRRVGLKKVFVNDKDSELRKKLLEILPPSSGGTNVKKDITCIDDNNNSNNNGNTMMASVDKDHSNLDGSWHQVVSESNGSLRIIKVEVPMRDPLRSNNSRHPVDKLMRVSESLSVFAPTVAPVVTSSIEKHEKLSPTPPVHFDIISGSGGGGGGGCSNIGENSTLVPAPLSLRTVTDSVGSPSSSTGSDKLDELRPTRGRAKFRIDYPNVSAWSAVMVANFFSDIGYVNEAKVFVEQEIDGASLLLLQRTDVLSNLGLKLGPALKMFCHIIGLQDAATSY